MQSDLEDSLGSVPMDLLNKYKSFRKSVRKESKGNLNSSLEHMKMITAENEALKHCNKALNRTVELYRTDAKMWKDEFYRMEREMKAVDKERKGWEEKWMRYEKDLQAKDDYMNFSLEVLERDLKRVHDMEKAKMNKKFAKEMKHAAQEFKSALKAQKRESKLEMEKHQIEINKTKSFVQDLKYYIQEKVKTIRRLETTLAKEGEYYERIIKAERQKAYIKVDKLKADLDYLLDCYKAIVGKRLDKQVSALNDTLERTNIIVKQKDAEVKVAKIETNRLHGLAANMEMTNVQLNLRMVKKTKKLSELESKLEAEASAREEARLRLIHMEAHVKRLQQEYDGMERKSLFFENETEALQEKLKSQQDLFEHFQVDLQGCVNALLDRPLFQKKFKELAHLYLDQGQVDKLGNVVQSCQEKMQRIRTNAQNIQKSLCHKNRLLKSETKRIEESCAASLQELRKYNSKLAEDLGLLREQSLKEKTLREALEFRHLRVPQHDSPTDSPTEEHLDELGPDQRAVKQLDCIPTGMLKEILQWSKEESQPQQQQDALSPLIAAAKLHQASVQLEVASERKEEPEIEAFKTTMMENLGKAFPVLPPIQTSPQPPEDGPNSIDSAGI